MDVYFSLVTILHCACTITMYIKKIMPLGYRRISVAMATILALEWFIQV